MLMTSPSRSFVLSQPYGSSKLILLINKDTQFAPPCHCLGSPLQCKWKSSETHEPKISQEEMAKIIFQLEVITWQLSRLCFDRAGLLFEEDGEFQIKTCLSRGLLLNERYSLGDLHRGPFNSENDYYEAHILAFFEHVKYLPLSHHCFFAPIPARSEYDDYAGFRKASDG